MSWHSTSSSEPLPCNSFSKKTGIPDLRNRSFARGGAFDIFKRQEQIFYGHGCYSDDGKYLYVTENDYEKGYGSIAVSETGSMELVGEIPSCGILIVCPAKVVLDF
jgi:hypothetical protein